MIEIKDYQENKRFQHHFDVIRANAPVSYGGLKLYEGKRNYLMQSPKEFAATLCYLEEYFVNKKVNYLEIGTASNLTNSMIWNSLNIKENIILDNLECPYTAESLVGNLSFKQNTVLIVGDSTQDTIKEKVEALGYEYNLMLIDGNHDYEYVTKDFEYYYRFLSDDGLLIFHDIDNDAVPGVRKFVTTNPILNTNFTQSANFIDNNNYLNKNTFGSQCGIGIYKKI
jgi:predicted O-methyltransferase YrrM|tara:strand:- start:303 stop:980 length:678 start_codon:yes stop_codon:yes gene_type:complete